MRPEIERIVEIIRHRYPEHLYLSDLSEEVGLSRFHMARLFTQETGLPPGHYHTAVRLEQARWKLLSTNDTIADVSLQVGYASLGTFTTRFTKVTGVSPGKYRRLAGLGADAAVFATATADDPFGYGTVVGRIQRFDGLVDEPLYVAAFPADRNGLRVGTRPARCIRVPRSDGLWRLPHVPEGVWSMEVVSRTFGRGLDSVAVANSAPFAVTPGSVTHVHLSLQPSWKGASVPGREIPVDAAAQLPDIFRT